MNILRLLFNFSILLTVGCFFVILLTLAITPVLPTGDWLAFSSMRDGGDWDIFLTDLQRHMTIALTEDDPADNIHDLYPRWSPDGAYITFMSSRDADYELYMMDALGGNVRNLSNEHTGEDGNGVWSPDGTQIVFDSRRYSGNSDLYLIEMPVGNLSQLTFSENYDGFASWSPDGTQIVYTTVANENTEIFRIDAAEGEASLVNISRQPYNDNAPSWSPDGRYIAFYSDRDGNDEIYIMDADGSNQRNLTNFPAEDTYPMWLPDGSGVLFTSNRDGYEDIFLQPIQDGSAVGAPQNMTNHPVDDRFAAMRP